MANWNERRRRVGRHPKDHEPNGSWSPYNEEPPRRADDHARWEDRRMGMGMGMGEEWRYPSDERELPPERDWISRGDDRDDRHTRDEWRARHEPSRAERSRGQARDDDRGYARDDRRSDERWRDAGGDDQRWQTRDDYDRARDDRDDDVRWRARGDRANAHGSWRDDQFGGWRDEERSPRDDTPRRYAQARMPDDERRRWEDDERSGFSDDQRDWRPEQNRATHDRDTHLGLHVRDEWRPSAPGDWRRGREWSPEGRRGLASEMQDRGNPHHRGDPHPRTAGSHHRGGERHRDEERDRGGERYRGAERDDEPWRAEDHDRRDDDRRGADDRGRDARWREDASGVNERTWRGADDPQVQRDEERRDEQRRYDEREWQRGGRHGRHRHD